MIELRFVERVVGMENESQPRTAKILQFRTTQPMVSPMTLTIIYDGWSEWQDVPLEKET